MIKDFPMELITGNEKIDLQHMELVARIKMLNESYLNDTNKEKLAETFEYIKCYIDEHFKTEENFMSELEYPHINRHKLAHKEFTQDYMKLDNLFKKDGISSEFNLDFNVKLIDWLHNHVLMEDKFLADYIYEKEMPVNEEKTI